VQLHVCGQRGASAPAAPEIAVLLASVERDGGGRPAFPVACSASKSTAGRNEGPNSTRGSKGCCCGKASGWGGWCAVLAYCCDAATMM
jgi:hypothetical protein